MDGTLERDARIRDELLRAHDQLRRTYRRFLTAVVVAFAGFASCIARRIVDHDDSESYAVIVVLSLAATLLGALDAREARVLHGRMHALLRHH
jgi:hypothetical protein